MEQQQYLKDAQITAHNLVITNLRELNDEKALIRSGHAQLAAMTEEIRNKLGNKYFFSNTKFLLQKSSLNLLNYITFFREGTKGSRTTIY